MDGSRRSAGVVTVSDGVSQGTREDSSGDAAAALLGAAGFEVRRREVVPDERDAIEPLLRSMADEDGIALVVTTGGTGFGPRDVTPEATKAVLEREAPGLADQMRRAGLEKTPMAALSRGIAGSRRATLILNLPGSTQGVREGLDAVLPVLPHAVELLGGNTGPHPTGHGSRAPLTAPQAEPTGRGWVEVRAVEVEGSPPCRVGNTMRIVPGGEVHGTLGCAEFDEAAVRDAAEIARSGAPATRRYTHPDGRVIVYFEPPARRFRLVVVSATDVARELRAHAERLGDESILVEPRSERVSDADRARPGVVIASVTDAGIDEATEVVFTDHDAPGIAELIAQGLRSPARFIGVMGSRRHVGPYLEELQRMGFGADDLERIRSPLGLDLGGREPTEIALSIAAGLVASRHGREGGWLDER